MTKRTFHYDPVTKEMVEGSGPRRVDGPSGDGWRFSDRLYSGNPFVASDGTVIDSKKKHRDYMKRTGLTTMDDYGDTWKKAAEERKKFFNGEWDRNGRREDVARAIEKLGERRGR